MTGGAAKRIRTHTEQIVIRLAPSLASSLRHRAHTEERPVAQVVRRAIRAYLDTEPGA